MEVPLEEWGEGVLALYWAYRSGALVSGREGFTTSGCENKRRLWLSETKGCVISGTPPKGPIHRHTH